LLYFFRVAVPGLFCFYLFIIRRLFGSREKGGRNEGRFGARGGNLASQLREIKKGQDKNPAPL
jgi:hypothetical protein